MSLMIEKVQIAQEIPFWGENILKSTIKGKHMCQVVFNGPAALIPMRLQVVNGCST